MVVRKCYDTEEVSLDVLLCRWQGEMDGLGSSCFDKNKQTYLILKVKIKIMNCRILFYHDIIYYYKILLGSYRSITFPRKFSWNHHEHSHPRSKSQKYIFFERILRQEFWSLELGNKKQEFRSLELGNKLTRILEKHRFLSVDKSFACTNVFVLINIQRKLPIKLPPPPKTFVAEQTCTKFKNFLEITSLIQTRYILTSLPVPLHMSAQSVPS